MTTARLAAPTGRWVPETGFGKWFLGTETWRIHVLERALADLDPLIPARRSSYPVILDIGCGCGRSFRLLHERFRPERMIGVDICAEMLDEARRQIAGLPVSLHCGDCTALPLADESVDLLFCHQTFHHFVDQARALEEFRRVLKRGGVLLFAESTKHYIRSWIIRLLFRHPMDVQRDADAYIAMVRAAGFTVFETSIAYPYLWWSRRDFGVLERAFGLKPRAGHAETLVNLVGVKE